MSDWQKIQPSQTSAWEPEKQKEIQGVYKKVRTNVGPNKSNLYILEQPDGSEIAVWGSVVLDSRFELIAVGSEVKVVYLGVKTSEKTKRQYKDFEVFAKSNPFVKVGDKSQDNGQGLPEADALPSVDEPPFDPSENEM